MGNSATECGELVCWSAFQADVVLFWSVHTAQPEFSKHGKQSQARLSSNSGTPGNWTTEAHRVDGLGPGWASSKSDFLISELLQNCSKAVFMGVEAPKAGSTDSLGGRSASREVNARDQLGSEQRKVDPVF
jgi:hypothetical protein